MYVHHDFYFLPDGGGHISFFIGWDGRVVVLLRIERTINMNDVLGTWSKTKMNFWCFYLVIGGFSFPKIITRKQPAHRVKTNA